MARERLNVFDAKQSIVLFLILKMLLYQKDRYGLFDFEVVNSCRKKAWSDFSRTDWLNAHLVMSSTEVDFVTKGDNYIVFEN